MKKIALPIIILFFNCANDNSIEFNWADAAPDLSGIEFPWIRVNDENFELYLETHNANGDEVELGSTSSLGDGIINNQIPKAKIETVTNLNISGLQIEDLFAIRGFTGLEILNCSDNDLGALDVSFNVALRELNFDNNHVSNFTSQGADLLVSLSCINNAMSTINLTSSNLLEFIDVRNNMIASLSLSLNGRLRNINCSNNQIEVLTIINNPDLETFDCSNNNLEILNVANNNNSQISFLNAMDNPNLNCIEIDPTFTPMDCQLQQNELGWCKDDTTIYAADCG